MSGDVHYLPARRVLGVAAVLSLLALLALVGTSTARATTVARSAIRSANAERAYGPTHKRRRNHTKKRGTDPLPANNRAPAASVNGTALFPGTYSHDDPIVHCEVDYDASGGLVARSIQIDSPVMATPRPQQLASYQVVVFRWSGSAWVYDNELDPIGATTTFSGYALDTWGAMPSNSGFNVNIPGYYRIAIMYRWYWNGSVERSQYEWAGPETQVFSKPPYMPWYGDTGDWCYIG